MNYSAPGSKTDGRANTPGLEDVHYNLKLDTLFLNKMYGLAGLSTALSDAVWPGNPPAPTPIGFATRPPLTPGGPRGATFNSWILPNNVHRGVVINSPTEMSDNREMLAAFEV